jgi:hypothetical protein
MLQTLLRTATEILDSKKAAYSFVAAIGASVLHLYFGVSVQDALLLVSPLGVATISQAHVDASAAKSGKTSSPPATTTTGASSPQAPAVPTPVIPAADEAGAASADPPKAAS